MTNKKIVIATILVLLLASTFIIGHYKFSSKSVTDLWKIEYEKKREKRLKGIQSNEEATIKELQKYFHDIKTKFGEKDPKYPANYLMLELNKAKSKSLFFKSSDTIEWIQRGPGNVGGRTRSIWVDPDDPTHNTWIAGSATGGAWKTTDCGASWEFLSTEISYLATTTIAGSKANSNVIYLGTGESFPGSMQTTGGGIFKSIDKGDSWIQLSFTASNEDFRYINRLCVDPQSENIIVAATNTGIFKSIDGGETWQSNYLSQNSIEDLKSDTSDFSTMYAAENSVGILKSVDAGETWNWSSKGIGSGYTRFEIAISPTNTNKIYCSVGRTNDSTSHVYASMDKGENWNLLVDDLNPKIDYLGGQAEYDNTIAVNPFYEDSVFVGGVNIWKIGVKSTTRNGNGTVSKFDTVNTGNFLDFVPFTGNLLPGMNTGNNEEATNLVDNDFVSIEIRFGSGLKQKAHRFFVPAGATSGVPAANYTYQDYVDVPFQVWDVTNNRQLMCSFRDQERDGNFNLYERTGDAYGLLGREYLFINAVPYNASNPDPNIAVQGGRSYKLIYFFWPTLKSGGAWEPDNLTDSKITIDYIIIKEQLCGIKNVSDAYDVFSGKNTYNQTQGQGKTSIPGFHPDHHALVMVPVDKLNKKFWIINGNDGGLGISKDNGGSFTQIKEGYVTTQFYGVSKKPYRNEYIGGMQDNGTWQSPSYTDATIDEGYYFRIGGDGFETVWNRIDTNKIMGSIYNNAIYKSTNHGLTWSKADNGINGDGPFITKLTMIPSNPNKVFAVGTSGLFYTGNFATTAWKLKVLGEGWLPTGYTSVTSQHHVEYSIANDSIIWAGAALNNKNGWNIFVSSDQGNSFSAVNYPTYEMPSFISGIATHPTQPETAYLLYSVYGEPKILRTENLGQTWEDITGFEGNSSSSNGFPDVGCLSLLVFPDNPSRIWAGTEIGIVESNDNGESWHLLNSSLPYVPIWQMFMQDNQIVVATYGRGIWTYQYGDIVNPPEPPENINNAQLTQSLFKVYPNPTNGLIKVLPLEFDYNNAVIKVYNSAGSVVYSSSDMISRDGKYIDLSRQEKGVYILIVKIENKLFTQRILLK
jgi:hypothetical protein